MVWVTWRQHRAELVAAAAIGLLLAVAIIASGIQMRSAYDARGVAGCLTLSPPPSCDGVVQGFQDRFQLYIGMYQWLNVLPLLLGIFIGAPLVAREVERGTDLLAWTQGVTRTRWIVTKLGLLAAVAIVAGTAYTLLMTWWRQPLDWIDGSGIRPDAFDLEGIVPVGYFLAALSLGIAAGTLLRRTLPAMGVAIISFLALRFGTIALFRPNFVAPLLASAPIGGPSAPSIRGAWILADTLKDPAGHEFNGRFAFDQLCAGSSASKEGLQTCLQQHGIVESLTYQPASRFWEFQVIEIALFLGVAIAALALAVWWVRRRIS